jgi:AAA domain
MFALVLTGAPGAGKSSVLEALSDGLLRDDVRHAMIETEALTSAHPALEDEQWVAPVQAVCALYRRFGYELLLIVATVESEEDLRRLAAAIGAEEHAVVALVAAETTLRRRIVAREPEQWSGLDALVESTGRIAAVIADLKDVTLTLNTDGESPGDVARSIRTAFPHALRPAGD